MKQIVVISKLDFHTQIYNFEETQHIDIGRNIPIQNNQLLVENHPIPLEENIVIDLDTHLVFLEDSEQFTPRKERLQNCPQTGQQFASYLTTIFKNKEFCR